MKDLNKYLLSLNACSLSENINSEQEAVDMLFSPQGREFCLKTGFPSLPYIRENKDAYNAINGVFIDIHEATTNLHKIVAVGMTELTVEAMYPTELFKVVCLHGAKVRINASKYAVVTVVQKNGYVDVVNDGTAKVIFEK